MFLAQQEGQLGVFFVSRVVGVTTLGRSVACRTFQRFRIRLQVKANWVQDNRLDLAHYKTGEKVKHLVP